MRTPDDVRWYRLSLGALVLAAWIALAAWGASPFAGLLSHREIGRGSLSLMRLSFFTGGWMLMTIAMMLPGSLPLINLFRRMVDRRSDRPRLVALLILGYLGVWAVFGVAAYRGDVYVHEAVTRLPAFGAVSAWIGVGLLLVAGLYQITPLKQMCLDKCRSPYSFLVEHWRGKVPGRDAFRLGVRHGLFCVGCCWTVMLLMFAIGVANLGWMLALGALMAAERTVRWGRRLTTPIGLLLVLCALGLAYRVPLVVAAFGGP